MKENELSAQARPVNEPLRKYQVEQAAADLERGDKAAARSRLRELLLLEPDNASLWLLLARAVRTREQAVYCLERVLRLAPNHPEARAWLEDLERTTADTEQHFPEAPVEEQVVRSSRTVEAPDLAFFRKRFAERLDELFAILQADFSSEGPEIRGESNGWTWECDPQGKYLACSAGVQGLLGISPQDFVGQFLAAYRLAARSRVDVVSVLQDRAEFAEIPVTFIKSNGDAFHGRLHVSTITGQDGKFLGWHGFTEMVNGALPSPYVESSPGEVQQVPVLPEHPAQCAFLGFIGDPQTCYTYPHPANSCLRQAHPVSIKKSHQATFCLTDQHVNCPIYYGNANTDRLDPIARLKKRRKKRFWFF